MGEFMVYLKKAAIKKKDPKSLSPIFSPKISDHYNSIAPGVSDFAC